MVHGLLAGMSDLTITLLILVVAVAVFVWNRIPVGIVALGVALALWATGVLSLEQSLAGFGSPTVILIAALFVAAEGLDASGITTWAGQQVIAHAGDSRVRLLVLTMLMGALVSALITPNGAAAALIPMVVVLAVRLRMRPSHLLMPMAFSAHAGSLLVLTGSPINVLISEAAADAGGRELRFFEFARVGIPLVLGTVLIVVLFGSRLLPKRTTKTLPRDLSQLPRTLLRQYIREAELARLIVEPESTLAGLSRGAIDLRPYGNTHLIGVLDSRGQPQADGAVSAGTVLLVRGPGDGIEQFASDHDLSIEHRTDIGPVEYGLVSRDYGVAEVIVTPRSTYIGDEVFPGMVTDSGELVVLAVQRHGEDLGADQVVLKAGDSLLLQGHWDALDQHTQDPNVLLVDSPDAVRRQTVPLSRWP
jgi:di/tricarboxylate transporter